ncbi:Rrf2 family transcriptional regulator [uncultured Corynebacterium sp.]|uniref:RrF2 family transcriptional regulator n=1 Tax=uncultured Corynebacterium sp. TaxID=159447 RepID=UPI00345BF531
MACVHNSNLWDTEGMHVSKGVEWALHTTLLLAQAPEGSWTARRTIAEFYDLPEPYLAKYLQRLVAAGVLVATTGPRGGYRLAAPPEEITALAVFEAIEGSAPAFTCQSIRRQGRGAATDKECQRKCIIHSLVDSADAAWRAQLAGKTVADLVDVLPNTLKGRTTDILSEATSGAGSSAKRRR